MKSTSSPFSPGGCSHAHSGNISPIEQIGLLKQTSQVAHSVHSETEVLEPPPPAPPAATTATATEEETAASEKAGLEGAGTGESNGEEQQARGEEGGDS